MLILRIHLGCILSLLSVPIVSLILRNRASNHLTVKIVFSKVSSDGEKVESSKISQEMNVFERLLRAVSFYSTAVPVFASYKVLEERIKLVKSFRNVSAAEEEKEYQRLHEWGSHVITEKIKELRGFYVKTGQIISTRVDIFPEQYTSKLSVTMDALDPVPTAEICAIVREELLQGGELSELFSSFDEEPLGSASIAQVHRARLLDGRTVAVKVQRPGVDAKLLADIGNLKNFAQIVGDSLPLDYYKIFCELEKTLRYELDFFHEAQSAAKIAAAVAHNPRNKPRKPAVIVPLPLPGLVSRRVLVMEFVEGVPLSKLAAEMEKTGVKSGSPVAKLFGMKLISALTDAYASMIFGSGIIHGDPHPGNIFVTENGEIALLDCGQVKELTNARRLALARLILLLDEWAKLDKQIKLSVHASPNIDAATTGLVNRLKELSAEIAKHMATQEIAFKSGTNEDCAVALGLLLFGDSDAILPGGYAGQELSLGSPIAQVISFPFRIHSSRASYSKWSEYAREAANTVDLKESLPIWNVAEPVVASTQPVSTSALRIRNLDNRIRFREVLEVITASFRLLISYLIAKVALLWNRYVPDSYKKWFLSVAAKIVAFVVLKKKKLN